MRGPTFSASYPARHAAVFLHVPQVNRRIPVNAVRKLAVFVADAEPTVEVTAIRAPDGPLCLACGSHNLVARQATIDGTLLVCVDCDDERMQPCFVAHQHTPAFFHARLAI